MNNDPEIIPGNAVATRPAHAVAAPQSVMSSVDLNALFTEAVKQGGAMEVIRELRQMEEGFHQRQAKAAADEAMAQFQAECPIIIKEKAVPTKTDGIAYRYAPIENIEAQIKPLELKFGFSHSFPVCNAEPGWVTATCLIRHKGGHERTASVRYPIGGKTAIMSDTQQYAGAETFCKRRALVNGYGLTLAGEDFDGASGKTRTQAPTSKAASKPAEQKQVDPITPLKAETWQLLTPVRGPEKNWDRANHWCWRQELLDAAKGETLPALNEARYRQLITALKNHPDLNQ